MAKLRYDKYFLSYDEEKNQHSLGEHIAIEKRIIS